jgi:hypothetical protein
MALSAPSPSRDYSHLAELAGGRRQPHASRQLNAENFPRRRSDDAHARARHLFLKSLQERFIARWFVAWRLAFTNHNNEG